jgi:DNA-binding transcriptional MerR regulator
MIGIVLTTGDVARRLDVSPERVRQLERAGVLTAIKTAGGFRIYSAVDVEKVRRQRAETGRRR